MRIPVHHGVVLIETPSHDHVRLTIEAPWKLQRVEMTAAKARQIAAALNEAADAADSADGKEV